MKFADSALVEQVVTQMRAEIARRGFEVLTRYPSDLLVHDRATLECLAVPGSRLGWKCGNLSTHIVPLGLHPRENEMVPYLTKDSDSDRFYQLSVRAASFTLSEVGRDAFHALHRTSIPYVRKGGARAFTLYRGDVPVGSVAVDPCGDCRNTRYTASIVPMTGIREVDYPALRVWANYAARELCGHLFFGFTEEWSKPVASSPSDL